MSRRAGRTTFALALPLVLFIGFGAARVAAPVGVLGLLFDEPAEFAVVAAVVSVAGAVLLFIRPIELRVADAIVGKSRPPSDEEHERLRPMFERLGARSGIEPERLILRIQDAPELNAGAGAGHVLLMTRGALALQDERLEAVLAHELGHHRGLHPLLTMVVWWVSLPGVLLAGVFQLLRRAIGGLAARLGSLGRVLAVPLIVLLLIWQITVMWIYYLGDVLAQRAARVSEFEADGAAARWGYAAPLAEALEEAASRELEPEGLLARMQAEHPPTGERVERLAAWGPAARPEP